MNNPLRHTALLLLVLLGCTGAAAQLETTPIKAGRTADGVVYYLPKTTFQLHLLVEKQTYRPGPFARYAERYLRLPSVAQEELVSHQIADISITPVGVRDTSKCYVMRLKGGKAQTADVRLSDDGVLLAINAEPMAFQPRQAFQPAAKHPEADARRFLTADALKASSTAKMAELTAQQMVELQEHRQLLITGEADEQPQDEQQLRLMLAQIDSEYRALLSLFTGTIVRDTLEHQLTLCPTQPVSRQVLFRISRHLGLVDSDDLAGEPYYISIQNLTPDNYPATPDKKAESLYVNVPATARLTLERGSQHLASFDVPVAQFGYVEKRDASLFKRYVTHLTLHPATGVVTHLAADTEGK